MASDPEGALALAALQVDALSVAAQQLPAVRGLLARQNGRELAALKPDLFRQRTAIQVREFLQAARISSAVGSGGRRLKATIFPIQGLQICAGPVEIPA